MSRRLAVFILVGFTTLFLAACGSDGGSPSVGNTPSTSGVTSGVAVDPYIVGAVFEEVSSAGKILQAASSESDDQGQFFFPKALTTGSTVRLKISQPGTHGNAPFSGMLKRKVLAEDIGQIVVSPMTTLVANGMSPAEVAKLLADAGFQIDQRQVYSNPMLGLDGVGPVSDSQLEKLRANMAINAFLRASGNFDMGSADVNTASHFEVLQEMGQATKDLLNSTVYNDLASQFSADTSLTEPFQLNDLIQSSVVQLRDLVQQTRSHMQGNGGHFDRTQFMANLNQLKGQLQQIVRNYIQKRQDANNNQPPVDGQSVFTDNCSMCHNIGNGGLMDLTGKGTKAQAKINGGHNGRQLTAAELTALADYLDNGTGGTTPPDNGGGNTGGGSNPADGTTLYANNCAVCHGDLANSSKTDRTAAAIQSAIDGNVGGMGSLSSLNGTEVQAIADVLTTSGGGNSGGGTTPADGATLYAANCAGCHSDLANTSKPGRTSTQIQAAIDADTGGMGYLNNLTMQEVQAIADVLPAAPPVDPTLPPDGIALYNNECAGCHGNLANTSKPGRTAAEIQGAIDANLGGMGYLSSLTAADIQAITDALPAPPAPTPGPVDGVALYGSNCAGCHGNLASTSKPGRTAAQIQSAIDANTGGMGFLSSLTAAEVQAISDALPAAPAPTPGPVDGVALYGSNCAGCHGNLASTSKPGRTAAQIQSAIDGNTGGMGFLSSLTAAEVQAISDALPAPPTPTPGPVDGAALYGSNCAGCHGNLASTSKPGRTAAEIQSAIDGNLGGMGFLSSLTAAEVQAISDALPAAPTPTPGPVDGVALYGNNCAGCHGNLASTSKPGRTAAQIQSAINANTGGMGFLSSLATAEVQAIADALPAPPAPIPGPVDGVALYGSNCASCHGNLASTSKPGRTGAEIQSAIDSNLGGMGFLSSLTAAEVQAISDALPAPPAPTPGPVDGVTLYDSNCASCHGSLASTSKPGRTAAEIQNAIDGNTGGMGFLSSLTAAEVQAIADALPVNTGGGGPDYSDCTACHGQPPNGNTAPNTAGAHAAHKALPGVGTDCAVCHTGHDHNGQVDLGFPAAYDAKNAIATDDMNGKCSNIICHGGKTTPDWWSGSIAVNSQCTSCHASGTGEYNSYNSGMHSKHIGKGYACTVCHNTGKMGNHFGDLTTSSFETSPSSTIGGGSTSVGSYSGGKCSSIQCHGSENWN